MKLSLEHATLLPKYGLHDHYDCDIRPEHVLGRGTQQDLAIPERFKSAWRLAGSDQSLQVQAAAEYRQWLQGHARESLTNYLTILWDQVLPTLQTGDDLYNTMKQRIDDAIADGFIFLKLRFAPNLHRKQGLRTFQQVIDPLQQAVSEAPFPVRLVISIMRAKTGGRLARQLADAVIRNPYITTLDLAGDESRFPGVLKWWLRQARRVQLAGKQTACHIGEAYPITDEDHERLDSVGCTELGHAVKGDPRDKTCTTCMTSNLLTHVFDNPADYPIDRMFEEQRAVTVELDGTLLTGTTQSREYCLINDTFDWNLVKFFACNLNALRHIPLPSGPVRNLLHRLYEGFCHVLKLVDLDEGERADQHVRLYDMYRAALRTL